MTYRQLEWDIRWQLRQLPGSHLCPVPGCLVITQGGTTGLAAHLEKVHGAAGKQATR